MLSALHYPSRMASMPHKNGVSTAQLTLALLLIVSAALAWKSLYATFSLALHNDQYTHILLILPVSIGLIYMEWPYLKPVRTPAYGIGSALILASVIVAALTVARLGVVEPDVQLSCRMLALVLFWIGACTLCLGSQVAKALIFPLCFLFWLVPWPQSALATVINLLQHGSALSAHWLFNAAGVPVSQDGFVLTIPGLSVEVAQECSSIRSSSMLLVTTMVLAQVLLRSTWRKTLAIFVAVPLSVVKNGLRIFTIAMLGTRVDPAYLTGRLHHQGGIVFLAIALVIEFALIWILRRAEEKETNLPLTTTNSGHRA